MKYFLVSIHNGDKPSAVKWAQKNAKIRNEMLDILMFDCSASLHGTTLNFTRGTSGLEAAAEESNMGDDEAVRLFADYAKVQQENLDYMLSGSCWKAKYNK